MSDLLDSFAQKARDHARTPMQVRTTLSLPAMISFNVTVERECTWRLHDRNTMDARKRRLPRVER
jgi:hypothetical protein